MKQGTIETLFGYWNRVRAGRIAPRRLDIEPSHIAGILAETFMLERTAEGEFVYRLAGTRLCELFGYELRGTDFLTGWTQEDRLVLERNLAAVFDGSIAHIAIEANADSRYRVQLEAVLLPLLHAGNNVGRVIGAMSPTFQPPWLDKGRLFNRRLVHHKVVLPEGWQDVARPIPLSPERLPQRMPSGGRIVRSERRQFRVLEGGLAQGGTKKP